MRLNFPSRKVAAAACALALVWPLAATARQTPTTTSPGSASKKNTAKKKSRTKNKKVAGWRRGQQKIDSQRTREIQAALIREHYMGGQPTGVWDQTSQHAMERYQADNGWQSKSVPDSRALIKLGLGPDHERLLNPESAMTAAPGDHGSAAANNTDPQKK